MESVLGGGAEGTLSTPGVVLTLGEELMVDKCQRSSSTLGGA